MDDSPDVLLLCKVHLEYEGYETDVAGRGFEALESIRTEPPRLALERSPAQDDLARQEAIDLLRRDQRLSVREGT